MLTPDEIRAIRKRFGRSQEWFAQTLGVSFATINRWERGHYRPAAEYMQTMIVIDEALKRDSPVSVQRSMARAVLEIESGPKSVERAKAIRETLYKEFGIY
jgi:DNA-binding XRE family transcriptional regulator